MSPAQKEKEEKFMYINILFALLSIVLKTDKVIKQCFVLTTSFDKCTNKL